MIIPFDQPPLLLIMLQHLLIRCICSAPAVSCNMPKIVTVVALYLMHQRNKRTFLPLKSNGASMIISRSKISVECRCSLIFSSLLLVLLFATWLLDLFLVSLVLTFFVGIVCYSFLGLLFVIFSCVQTRITLLKSKTRFIQW